MTGPTEASAAFTPRVFICYRREDASGHAGRLYDALAEKLGEDQIFMDVSGIEPGADFVERIDESVGVCNIMLVVIGRDWLESREPRRKRRLDNPNDYVRLEIFAALQKGIRLIPTLVRGARMPDAASLPQDIRKLTRKHAFELRDERWISDTAILITALERTRPQTAPSVSSQQPTQPSSGEARPRPSDQAGIAPGRVPKNDPVLPAARTETFTEIPLRQTRWLSKRLIVTSLLLVLVLIAAVAGLWWISVQAQKRQNADADAKAKAALEEKAKVESDARTKAEADSKARATARPIDQSSNPSPSKLPETMVPYTAAVRIVICYANPIQSGLVDTLSRTLTENGYHVETKFDENLVQMHIVNGIEIEYPINNGHDLAVAAERVTEITRSVIRSDNAYADYRPARPNLPEEERALIIRIARSVVGPQT